jgi:adenylate cyclase
MVRGADLLGDGVNIAARLEGMAEPGGLCISGDAHRQARKALTIQFRDLGLQQVKNIEEPVHAFAWAPSQHVRPKTFASLQSELPPLPDKPSIAVLPFTNMSGDAEQDYFADGMVEDIITALSRIRSFFVIARNSSFTYKGRAVDMRQVGRELGVRYVLGGSVRKVDNRVRIAGQLIEAQSGSHVWADRFDGGLEDIFDLQDQITQSVVGAIEPSLRRAEIERSRRKRPNELGAYDLYLHALPLAYATGQEPVRQALYLLQQAINLDPSYAYSHALVAWCYIWHRANAWKRDEDQDIHGVEHADRALMLAPDDPEVLCIAAGVRAYIARDLATASDLMQRSLALNPNSALALAMHGWIRTWLGDHTVSLDSFMRAKRLSPLDPVTWFFDAGVGNALMNLKRYREALDALARAMRANPEWTAGHRGVAVCAAYLGQFAVAREAVDRILIADTAMSVSRWRHLGPIQHPETLEHFLQGLALAGLPE